MRSVLLAVFAFAFFLVAPVNATVITGEDQSIIFNVDPIPVDGGTWEYLVTNDSDWFVAEYSADGSEFKFYFLNGASEWMFVSEFNATSRSLVITLEQEGNALLYVNGTLQVESVYGHWSNLVGKELVVRDAVEADSFQVMDTVLTEAEVIAMVSGQVSPLDAIYSSGSSVSNYVNYAVGLLAGLAGICGLAFGYMSLRRVL